jgi:hypothetical protein
MGIQLDLAEKKKAKVVGSKLETSSRAESSLKGGTSVLKNNGISQWKERGRGAGESTLGQMDRNAAAVRFRDQISNWEV